MCVCSVCGEKGEVRLVVRGGEGLGGRKETGEWETGGCVETCVRCLRAVFGCAVRARQRDGAVLHVVLLPRVCTTSGSTKAEAA